MRQILNISRKTKGRPDVLAAPDGGWTYDALASMPKGIYYVHLGNEVDDGELPQEMPPIDDQEITAVHALALVSNASKGWNIHIDALLKTIGVQKDLIVSLHAQLKKATEGGDSTNGLQTLADLAPIIKGLLGASKKQGGEKEGTSDAG